MVDVRVSFDYDAEQHDELTIRVGDIIKNVTTPEGGWWEGELNGKKGLFPDNFVEVIKNPEKSKDRDKEKDVGTVGEGGHRSSTKVSELAKKLRDGVHIGGGPPKKRESLNRKKLKAKASFAYAPENEDELGLEVGDVVEVLKQDEEGWWEGSLNGKIGMFPSNFVDLIDENGEEVEKTDEPKKEEEFHEIKGKKVHGIGFGNIFGGDPIKLKNKGAAGKKAGPPETAERKKEDKTESITMRDKPGSAKHQCQANLRNVDDKSVSPSRIIHIKVTNETRYFVDGESRSDSHLMPVRCSTPNRNDKLSDSSHIVGRPCVTNGMAVSNPLTVSLDISSIEPPVDFKVSLGRRTTLDTGASVEQTTRFTSPDQPQQGNNSQFISAGDDPAEGSLGSFLGSESLSTAHLTDSMILHKKRLSSPFECIDGDQETKEEATGGGNSFLNRSSSSLHRFRSFVKNLFVGSPRQVDFDAETVTVSNGMDVLLNDEAPPVKKRRWTLPLPLKKESSIVKEPSRTKIAGDSGAGDSQKETDSSSNNSKSGPDPPCFAYQKDDFLEAVSPCKEQTSPETYLASLNNYGRLPPYIQLIARRYNLLDVLDGKRKVLHSSHGHIPIKTYYFDDTKNHFLEQHDNSDEEMYSCDFYDDAGHGVQLAHNFDSILNQDTPRKGASIDDICLSEKEVEDISEHAVASVLFDIIKDPVEAKNNTLPQPCGRSSIISSQYSPKTPSTKQYAKSPRSPFSEARKKFFAEDNVNVSLTDPFEKYKHRMHHSITPVRKDDGSRQKIHVVDYRSMNLVQRTELPFTKPKPRSRVPPPKPPHMIIYKTTTKSPEQIYHEAVLNSPNEPNYSISLLTSFSETEEPIRSPEKYPSFMSMGCDEADITAPVVSADPSLELVSQQPVLPCTMPNYKWLQNEWQNPSERRRYASAHDSLRSEDSTVGVGGSYYFEDVNSSFITLNSKEDIDLNQTGKVRSPCVTAENRKQESVNRECFSLHDKISEEISEIQEHHLDLCKRISIAAGLDEIDSASGLGLTLVQGRTDLLNSTPLLSRSSQPRLSDSTTVGIQVPDDAFIHVVEGSETSSTEFVDNYFLTTIRSDIFNKSNLPKRLHDQWKRPSSSLEQSISNLSARINRSSTGKRDSLKRPLSWMYPEVSGIDIQSTSLNKSSTNRVLKKDQSNRYLIIDSSSTLTSIHSLRDSLCSRQSSILEGDPKLIQGSSEKRKQHRLWKRKKQPKILNPVELVSYKKVYEPGTPMYNMVPLLNRSLTGGDSLNLSKNVNQNHPVNITESIICGDQDQIQIPAVAQKQHIIAEVEKEDSTGNTVTLVNLTSSEPSKFLENSIEVYFHPEDSELNKTPTSAFCESAGGDDTLTPHKSPKDNSNHSQDSDIDTAVTSFVDNILRNAIEITLYKFPSKEERVAVYNHLESDMSFNALCHVAFGNDDADIQYDEMRHFSSSVNCKHSNFDLASCSSTLPDGTSYLHILDDLSTDTGATESTIGSPLFSSVPTCSPVSTTPCSKLPSDGFIYDYDTSIESLVADKSKRATEYYTITGIQPSTSTSSVDV